MEPQKDMILALNQDQDNDASPPAFLEEIILEILLRLPIKSLMQFKCVSKSWRTLISSYKFAKSHLKISTKNNPYVHNKLLFGSKGIHMDFYTCKLSSAFTNTGPTGFVYPLNRIPSFQFDRTWFRYDHFVLNDSIWMEGSCNGMVCVSTATSTLILWNPMTKQSRVLPISGTDLGRDFYGISFGFGYDEVHDDYKVVEFFRYEWEDTGETGTHVKVYSLRTNAWRLVPNWPGGDTFGGPAQFLNGKIHWSVIYDNEGIISCAIISHDLSTDVFANMALPGISEEEGDVRMGIRIFDGCLSVSCEYGTYMDVWVMKEYGVEGSWTKVVKIPFYLNLEASEFLRPSPICLMEDGKILINYGTNLSVYDLRRPRYHRFGNDFVVEGITFCESLVSPNVVD